MRKILVVACVLLMGVGVSIAEEAMDSLFAVSMNVRTIVPVARISDLIEKGVIKGDPVHIPGDLIADLAIKIDPKTPESLAICCLEGAFLCKLSQENFGGPRGMVACALDPEMGCGVLCKNDTKILISRSELPRD